MKNWKNWKKRLAGLAGSAMVISMLCVSAFAAEGDPTPSTSATVISAFTTGFQSIVSDALSMIAAAAPIAIGLAGVIFLSKKAMSWFKSMAK